MTRDQPPSGVGVMEVLSQGTKGQLKLLICIGDNDVIKKDIILSFIFCEETKREKSCCPAATSVVAAEAEFKGSKQQNFQPWTVHTVLSHGDLQEIYIVLPSWQEICNSPNFATHFSQALSVAIEKFSKNGSELIGVIDLTSIGTSFNYPIDFYAHHVLSSIEFSKPNFDTVLIFVDDVSSKKVFEERLRSLHFEIERPKGFGQPIIPIKHTNFKSYINKLFREPAASPSKSAEAMVRHYKFQSIFVCFESMVQPLCCC